MIPTISNSPAQRATVIGPTLPMLVGLCLSRVAAGCWYYYYYYYYYYYDYYYYISINYSYFYYYCSPSDRQMSNAQPVTIN